MKYLTYLNHYNIRQTEAQYLFSLYETLWKKLDSYFILNEDYIKNYKSQDRWEVNWALRHSGNPEIIKPIKPNRYVLMKKPEELLDCKIPSQILKRTTSALIPTQKEAIESVLSQHKIDLGLTWVNNIGFKKVMESHGIPVVHHEVGPFRSPTYTFMVYFDFSGVNGDTEFEERFKEFLKIADQVPILPREELIRILSPNHYSELLKILRDKSLIEYEAGVGLQVEVDTNLLLFNNGNHWVDPILKAQADTNGKVLVRNHPTAGFALKPSARIDIDDHTKTKAHDFIGKCAKIYTLNSSVGLEALLLGRKAEILGESPFRSLCAMDEETLLKALNFTVFGYLIPRQQMYKDAYYEYRLNVRGDERTIYLNNMKKLLNMCKKH